MVTWTDAICYTLISEMLRPDYSILGDDRLACVQPIRGLSQQKHLGPQSKETKL